MFKKRTDQFSFLCAILVDAGVFVLRTAPAGYPHLWSENSWLQLDAGLDHFLCWSHGPGNCGCYFCCLFWISKATHSINHCVYILLLPCCSPQSQWCHIGASLHSRTPFTYRIPADKWRPVIALNVLLAVAPSLLALRCHTNPAYFMKPVPKGQTNDEKKKK